MGLQTLDLLHAVGPFERVRNLAGSMDKNLLTRHRVEHIKLRNKGLLLELYWNGMLSSYLCSLSKGVREECKLHASCELRISKTLHS